MSADDASPDTEPARNWDDPGVPVGLPTAATTTQSFLPVRRPEGVNAGGTERASGVLSPALRARARRGPGHLGLQELLSELSPRDFCILQLLAGHRFLTTQHLESFVFAPHLTPLSAARTSRRVLRRLAGLRLVRSLRRTVGGLYGGSMALVWHLTTTGYRVVAAAVGREDGPDQTVRRIREPSTTYLAHHLAVADARLSVFDASQRPDGFQLVTVDTEPDCWRRFQILGRTALLAADLHVVTRSSDGEFEDRWFLEVDRATEHPPAVLRKCLTYEQYRRTGNEQKRAGVFPLVVWAVPHEQRVRRLERAIAGDRQLDPGLFRVVTMNRLGDLIAAGAGGQP